MTTMNVQPGFDVPAMRSRLDDRLTRLRRHVRVQMALEGLARTLAVAVGLLLASLIFDWWLELTRPARIGFMLVSLGIVGYVAWRTLIQPLRLRLDPIALGSALDRAAGGHELAPRIASVLQLPKLASRAHAPSPAMIARAVGRCLQTLDNADFDHRLDDRHRRWSAAALTSVVLLPVVTALLMPNIASLWTQRWVMGGNAPWPRSTTLHLLGVTDGRLFVPRGEPFVMRIAVEDTGDPTQTVRLRIDRARGEKQTVTLTPSGGGDGDFRYDAPPLHQPATAYLRGGDARLGPIAIVPIDRPRIVDIRLTSRHPTQDEPHVHDFAVGGDIALLPHTEVTVELVANVPVAEARVTPPRPFAHVDERTLAARWTHTEPVQMKIELRSAEGELVSHPVPISIGLRPDRPPRVSLRHTHVRQRIAPAATIPFIATARDDFGVAQLGLRARTDGPADEDDEGNEESTATEIEPLILYGPTSPASETNLERRHAFQVEPLQLSVGALLHLTARASDDRYNGPQSADSPARAFRIVAPEELFREILLRQQGLRAKFRKALEDTRGLRDQIATAVLPDDARALARKFRLTQRQIWQITRGLSDSAQEMRLNRLGGPEAYDLISDTVIIPLNRLHDQTMARQRRAIEQGDPTEALLDRQDAIAAEMEAILKAMAQWDSFIDVVNQLNEVIKLEQSVRDRTGELKGEITESIFDD